MDSSWQDIALGNLIRVEHGWPFVGDLCSEKLTGDPIVINIGNFRYTGGFRFDETTTREYRGEYPRQFELRPGDILLVMTCQTPGGEILGIPARVPADGRVYLHNQRMGKVVVLRPDRVRDDYLYWLFHWRDFNGELLASSTGTKILHTAPSRIEAFRFLLPSLAEQEAIAGMLNALDEKIELNRQTNRTLEAIVQGLFKSWFVEFDPVSARVAGRRPFGTASDAVALFPDHFELSAVGSVPAGWRVAPFSSLVDIVGGGTPKTDVPEYWNGDVPWFSVVDTPVSGDLFVLQTKKTITRKGLDESAARLLEEGTTIITARGTVGNLALAGRSMTTNQSCYGLIGKPGYGPFFVFFATQDLIRELQLRAHGSVFDTITRTTFDSTTAILPPPTAAARFDLLVAPLMARMKAHVQEGLTLGALRSTLLPRLLSGEARVCEAEKMVERAGA